MSRGTSKNSSMSLKTYSWTHCQRNVPPKGTSFMRFAQRRARNHLVGYHTDLGQLSKMRRDIDPKNSFHTNRGHFECLVMPFGLTNAPGTFQRLMNKVFAGNLDKFIAVYLDDILIFSCNLDEHWEHLRWALDQLWKAKLYGRQM